MAHDEINICVVGEETNPVTVGTHEVFGLSIDGEDLAIGFSKARNGRCGSGRGGGGRGGL